MIPSKNELREDGVIPPSNFDFSINHCTLSHFDTTTFERDEQSSRGYVGSRSGIDPPVDKFVGEPVDRFGIVVECIGVDE